MQENIKRVRTEHKDSGPLIATRIVDVLFSLVEIILAFRLVFKLFGANPGNRFVDLIYKITAPVTGLFDGIFNHVSLGGEDPEKIFEPSALIAIVVIAVLGWLVHRLVYPNIKKGSEQVQQVQTEHKIKPEDSIDDPK